jgi:hypothetical protein
MEFRDFLQLPEIKVEYKTKFAEFIEYFRKNYKSRFMDKNESDSLIIKLASVRTIKYLSELFNKSKTSVV